MKGGGTVSNPERSNPKKERESGPLTMKSLKKIVTIMSRAKITELDIEQDQIRQVVRGQRPVNRVD